MLKSDIYLKLIPSSSIINYFFSFLDRKNLEIFFLCLFNADILILNRQNLEVGIKTMWLCKKYVMVNYIINIVNKDRSPNELFIRCVYDVKYVGTHIKKLTTRTETAFCL